MADKNTMRVCIKCKQYRFTDRYGVCGKCKDDVPGSLYFDRIGKSIVPVRSNGTVLPREEWTRLSREIQSFYYSSSDGFIDEYNEEIRLEKPHLSNPVFGYVYLMRSENGYYKIGRTRDIDGRFYSICRQYPVKIELLHIIPCKDCIRVERAFHVLYADRCVQGEWFDLPASAVEKIKATTSDNVDEWLK